MIEGLHFDFTTEELTKHLRKKVEQHENRSLFYRQKVQGLADDGANYANYSGGNPVDALQRKVQEHEQKAEMFDVLLKHLVPNETYRLQDQDLTRLEIVSGIRW